jgi:hypothetical protein
MGAFTTPFRPSDISTGLVGYWKFNNDATDSGSNGFTLTANGAPTYTANGNYWKDEYSGVLNGSSQSWSRADNALLDMNGKSFTFFAWVKLDALGSTNTILMKGVGATTGYKFAVDTNGDLALHCQSTLSTGTNCNLSALKWHAVAVTYTTGTGVVSFYVDGNLTDTGTNAGTIADVAEAMYIGATEGSVNWFDGAIKDVAIWSAALTPLQIKSLALGVDLSKYAYRPNNVSTQPTHWWKLNEVSGNRADSVSTNPLTLTDNNTVLSSGGYVEGVSSVLVGANTEFLSVGNSTDFNFAKSDFSIRFRVKMTAIPGTYAGLISALNVDGTPGWAIVCNTNGTLSLIKAGITAQLTSTTALVAGVWYDIVLKRIGTGASDLKFFFDGVVDATTASGNETLDSDGTGMEIGRWYVGYDNFYASFSIEDFAIWKGYALTDAEIKSLACALPIQRQGIVSYYKLDEASGNAIDSIGANTLTETSGTIASATGMVSNGRDFDADDTECFVISDASQTGLDIVTDMFLCAWFKQESTTQQSLISKTDTGDGSGYNLIINGANTPYLYIAGATQASAVNVANGAFAHVAGNYSGATKEIYVNAVQTGTSAQTSLTDNANDFNLGARGSGAGYLDGILDEAVICKRYFRPEEIKAVYLKGLNGKEVTSSEVSEWNGYAQIIWVD